MLAAFEALSEKGVSALVKEVARRAGVGTGTVSRPFPTKQALYEAVVLDRAERLTPEARELQAGHDPAEAFFRFLSRVAQELAMNWGMSEWMTRAGFEVDAAENRAEGVVLTALRELLEAAQEASAIRADATVADVKALIVGVADLLHCEADPAAQDRMLAIVRRGLAPETD